jgi:mono/diheme cytochrome c family protein
MRTAFVAILILLLTCAVVSQTPAKPSLQKVAAPYSSPSSGKAMFDDYCASCHGADGKGSGPAAAAIKNGVPDITDLARSHGGEFPAFHVGQTIVGDGMMSAHGSKDMPVWGPVFSRLGQQSQAEIQLRIYNLTSYVESLQSK